MKDLSEWLTQNYPMQAGWNTATDLLLRKAWLDSARAAVLQERERILALMESRRPDEPRSVNWSARMFAYDEALQDIAAAIREG